MNKKYLVLIALLIFSVFLNLLFLFNFSNDAKDDYDLEGKISKAYNRGIEDAKTRYSESGLYEIDDREEVYSINGVVNEVDSNSIKISIKLIDPFLENKLSIRTVNFNSNTEMFGYYEKDKNIYSKELEKYNNSVSRDIDEDSYMAGLPLRYEHKEVGINDFKRGQNVFIESDVNIKNKDFFTAKKITIQK
ncbi:MAG: hypothetical protein U9Q85_00135 [Patescibacteria group bacterium]|nr:hypothetical protein [Patescibacteria group bacterium]